MKVPAAALRHPLRCNARIAFARQFAMYVGHVIFGLQLTQVGALLGRDRSTVAHGCAVVEDRRDEPGLNRVLSILEFILPTSYIRPTKNNYY